MGKLIRVNLTDEKTYVEPLNFEVARKLIGGLGYAAKLIYEEVGRQTESFDPENRLVIMVGPLNGIWSGGSKWTVASRSPLTYVWGEANVSGSWGFELKHAGFDGIVVWGKAEKPVYLWVHDGKYEIRKADHLWGLTTLEACDAIRAEVEDKKTRVAAIGPAGERLVRFACIVSDECRVAGRSGMGAVMGSKNLKAVAVRGEAKIPVTDEPRLRELRKGLLEQIKGSKAWGWTPKRIESLSMYGTDGALESLEYRGGLPVKNWTRGKFPGAQKITGETMAKTILTKRLMCPMCGIITCWRHVAVKTGPFAPIIGKGPEYETCAAFGSLCMNDNLESIAKANDLCDKLGTDTISTGSAIAFAMECYEKGIITKEDTGGLDLTWGNSESVVKMAEFIGRREGFGKLLGEGVKRASEKIGKGSEQFALHVKGLEFAMHEPRRWWSQALAYATNNRGACHTEGIPLYIEMGLLQPDYGFSELPTPFIAEGKPAIAKFHQDLDSTLTALGFCRFPVGGVMPFTLIAEVFTAVTGWEVDHWELLRCGERIWNLKRMFNVKMGISRMDDTLPKRFLEEPLSEGPAAGQVVPLKPMLDEYYKLRGWDADGKPTVEKLKELDLPDILKL